MNIQTRIIIALRYTSGKTENVEIRGKLTAPDRPVAGERIFWPYADEKIDPEDLGCELMVTESFWITSAPGKIIPCIYLAQRVNDTLDKISPCVSLCALDSCVMGARLLLQDPLIQWPNSSEWNSLPEKYEGIPLSIIQSMPAEEE